MGKKKVKIKEIILFLWLGSFAIHSNSQDFTKELIWNTDDSLSNYVFKDTTAIKSWGKGSGRFVTIHSEKLCINSFMFFIMIDDVCSGIYCPFIYIFEERNNNWYLKASTYARLQEKFGITLDYDDKKLIFKTKSGKIGELTFEQLLE
jgi:hypothetical protein